uniref:Uncharacterized protein n=1 Tax=Heterorhabditis bacteriophora TaxID=37862 RepID=A0A1I7XEL2_HETBA
MMNGFGPQPMGSYRYYQSALHFPFAYIQSSPKDVRMKNTDSINIPHHRHIINTLHTDNAELLPVPGVPYPLVDGNEASDHRRLSCWGAIKELPLRVEYDLIW